LLVLVVRETSESGNERRFTRYASQVSEHRMGTGASLGKEAVLAASGRVGAVAAGVGRVRRATFSKHPAKPFHHDKADIDISNKEVQ
jgi:hypothetical protein